MKFTIKTEGFIPKQILLDDKDISGRVIEATINLKGGYIPTVKLELTPDEIEIDGDFEILKSNCKWLNTPLDDVIQAAKNIYGDIMCQIEIGQGLQKEEGAYGVTNWCEDGRVIITLDADTPYVHLMETLAHELAHVVVGADHEHDKAWEEAFDKIYKEYDRYGSEKYSKFTTQ